MVREGSIYKMIYAQRQWPRHDNNYSSTLKHFNVLIMLTKDEALSQETNFQERYASLRLTRDRGKTFHPCSIRKVKLFTSLENVFSFSIV